MHAALLLLTLLAPAPPARGAAPAAALAPSPVATTSADLQSRIRGASGRVVLVNAWATWCVPCREEMPDLLRLRREFGSRGLELMLVSADFDDAVPEARAFLGKLGVNFPTWQKKQRDQEFIDGLDPSWSGALPFSVLHDRKGRRIASWEGRESYEQMRARIVAALESPGAPAP